MSASFGIGGFASGLAGGLEMGAAKKSRVEDRKYRDEDLALRKEELAARRAYGVSGNPFFPGGGGESGGGGGYGGYSGGAAKMDPMEIKAYAMEKYGLPEHVVDGMLMSAGDESGFDPGVNEANPTVAGSRGGFGLFQHTGPRRVAMEEYARGHNKPAADGLLQFDFAMQELQSSEKGAYDAMMNTKDAGEAAAVFTSKFLRPRADHLARRVAKYTSGQGWRPGKLPAKAEAAPVETAAASEKPLTWQNMRKLLAT